MTTYNDETARIHQFKKRRGYTPLLLCFQIVSLAISLVSAWFVWWVAGAVIDAADSFTTAPPITHWGGTAIIVFLISTVTFWAVAIFAATHTEK